MQTEQAARKIVLGFFYLFRTYIYHMKKKINPSEMSAEKRQEKFLQVFRRFDSIGEGAEFIAQATGCATGTVMVWRCKKKSGYGIPKRPFMMLMDAIEKEDALKAKK